MKRQVCHLQGPFFLILTSGGGTVGWGWLQSPSQAPLLPYTRAAPPGSAEALPRGPGCEEYPGAIPWTEMEDSLVRAARGAGLEVNGEGMGVVGTSPPLQLHRRRCPHTHRESRQRSHTCSTAASPFSGPPAGLQLSSRRPAVFAWSSS